MAIHFKNYGKILKLCIFLVFLLIASASGVTAQGWRWLNPLPQGNWLADIWSNGESEIFAVGYCGAIIHFDGTNWENMASGTTKDLSAIWGTGANNVFAAGADGTILHYDGQRWKYIQSGTENALSGIWGDPSGNVFFAGKNGTILKYDGSSLAKMESHTSKYLLSIWGRSATDIYAVGEYETVFHYDGTAWSMVHQGNTIGAFTDIWGSSATNLFVTGTRGIFHFDGTSWTRTVTGNINFFTDILGYEADNLYALAYYNRIYRYDGTNWTLLTEAGHTTSILALCEYRDASFLLAGNGVFEYDGAALSKRLDFPEDCYKGVWGNSPANVYVVGSGGTILKKSGAQWNKVQSGKDYTLNDIWGSSDSSIFTVGTKGTIQLFNGSEWVHLDSGSDKNLFALWGRSAADVFAIGEDGTILHYDGSSWTSMDSGTYYDLKGIWGSASNNIYVVGYHYYDGGGTIVINPGAGYVSDHPEAPGLIGAFSVYSTILHYDGNSWTRVYQDNNYYKDIWGSSPSNIFAVGPYEIVHFDGSIWSSISSSERYENLYAIWGTSGRDIYAMGDKTMHYDGTRWQRIPDLTRKYIYGMWGNAESGIYAVGQNGTILHCGGESLPQPLPAQSSTVVLTDMSSDSSDPAKLRRQYNLSDRFTPESDVQTFSATISPSGALALMRFKMNGLNGRITDLSLQKLLEDGTSLPFKDYAAAPASEIDGAWWITDEDGAYLASNTMLNSSRSYYVNFAVKDNGNYDQDNRPGHIRDPLVLGSTGSTMSSSSTGGGGGGCFIATAAYGSKMAPYVGILRDFRDRFLLGNPLGRAFVKAYYKHAPPYASAIAQSRFFRQCVRTVLFPIVFFAAASLKIGFWPTIVSAMMAVGVIALSIFFSLKRFIYRQCTPHI